MPIALVATFTGLLTCQLALALTTLYLHRAVSHKAIVMRPGLVFACRCLLWASTGIRPREWAAVHRRHHARTDVPGDPHSPVLEGYWKVQFYNLGLYRAAVHDPETLRKYSRDISVDKWDRALFDHGPAGLATGFCALWAVLGWQWALLAAGVHAVSYLLLNAAVNAIGHHWGRRPYPGVATNNQWLAFLTWGEGLHSNHHAAPTSARLALQPRQIDHGWWVIRLLGKLSWLDVRHQSVHLTAMARPEPGEMLPNRQPELVRAGEPRP
jgi:stearoyl-CoA desaturase (delta-9 desaturase)